MSGRLTQQGSASEKCGFVFHVLTVFVGLAYYATVVSNILHTRTGIAVESYPALSAVSSDFLEWIPDPVWSLYVPVAMTILFFAAPICYAVLNGLSAASCQNVDSIRDQYTRPATEGAITMATSDANDSSVSEICDIDVAIVNNALSSTIKSH